MNVRREAVSEYELVCVFFLFVREIALENVIDCVALPVRATRESVRVDDCVYETAKLNENVALCGYV